MDTSRRCACGCGTKLESKTGKPRRYVRGHNRRGKGNGWIAQGGYKFISRHGERSALHRVIVEEREGRRLQSDEIVHHVDWNPINNDPSNLVILTRREHMLLHLHARRRWTEEERKRA